MGLFGKLFSGNKGFASVIVETQNKLFKTYGVSQPNDAQKLRASFYLCISGMAILNEAGAGRAPIRGVIDRLVADASELSKPLSVVARDIWENSTENQNKIQSQLPRGTTELTKLNGLAAFDALYASLGQDLMTDILSHNKGPLGTPGYAGIVVVDGIFGKGRAEEHFMDITMQMLEFSRGLSKAI